MADGASGRGGRASSGAGLLAQAGTGGGGINGAAALGTRGAGGTFPRYVATSPQTSLTSRSAPSAARALSTRTCQLFSGRSPLLLLVSSPATTSRSLARVRAT